MHPFGWGTHVCILHSCDPLEEWLDSMFMLTMSKSYSSCIAASHFLAYWNLMAAQKFICSSRDSTLVHFIPCCSKMWFFHHFSRCTAFPCGVSLFSIASFYINVILCWSFSRLLVCSMVTFLWLLIFLKLLCFCLCLLDAIVDLHAMNEKMFNDFLIKNEIGSYKYQMLIKFEMYILYM